MTISEQLIEEGLAGLRQFLELIKLQDRRERLQWLK